MIDTFKEDQDTVYVMEKSHPLLHELEYKIILQWTREYCSYINDHSDLKLSMEFAGEVILENTYTIDRGLNHILLSFENDCDIRIEQIADGTTKFERDLIIKGFKKL